MSIENVAVIGAGFMGAGIAQVAAQAAMRVTLIDLSGAALERARKTIAFSLERFARKDQLRESVDAVLARIAFDTELDAARGTPFVFESVFERLGVKHEVLRSLEAICPETAVFASNTSTIPITRLAECLTHKPRLVGLHFFSPVPMNPMVEIIPAQFTHPDTTLAATRMAQTLRKHPLHVKKDIPGFLMNRMYAALAHEAIGLVEKGAGSVEDVDRGMQISYGMAIGPLTIADLVGLDVCLHVMENLCEFDPDWKLRPSPLLRKMVGEGKLGRKTGTGFYRYNETGKALGVSEDFAP